MDSEIIYHVYNFHKDCKSTIIANLNKMQNFVILSQTLYIEVMDPQTFIAYVIRSGIDIKMYGYDILQNMGELLQKMVNGSQKLGVITKCKQFYAEYAVLLTQSFMSESNIPVWLNNYISYEDIFTTLRIFHDETCNNNLLNMEAIKYQLNADIECFNCVKDYIVTSSYSQNIHKNVLRMLEWFENLSYKESIDINKNSVPIHDLIFFMLLHEETMVRQKPLDDIHSKATLWNVCANNENRILKYSRISDVGHTEGYFAYSEYEGTTYYLLLCNDKKKNITINETNGILQLIFSRLGKMYKDSRINHEYLHPSFTYNEKFFHFSSLSNSTTGTGQVIRRMIDLLSTKVDPTQSSNSNCEFIDRLPEVQNEDYEFYQTNYQNNIIDFLLWATAMISRHSKPLIN